MRMVMGTSFSTARKFPTRDRGMLVVNVVAGLFLERP